MNTNPTFSRRSFLKIGGTALASAPFILPSSVWAAETPPSERLTLGFIGIGTQARGLMNGFLKKKETRVVAVCDVDTIRRENGKKIVDEFYAKDPAASSNASNCHAYKDFRDLLARKDIDAVVVATPDHWHAIICLDAARAGKDIYCEKPLTQSIHEARSLVTAMRRRKRVFQTGSMQRSAKEFRTACELVRNGVIGKIKTVEVAIGGPGVPCDLPGETPEPGLDWDMWLGPAPIRPYHSDLSPRGVHKNYPNWRKYREYGGGMVTDWGAHHYDIAQWGLGMDDSGPVEIIPPGDRQAQYGAKLVYANGTEVLHKEGNGVWFFGTEGKIYVNRGKFELWIGDRQKYKTKEECDAAVTEYLSDSRIRLPRSTDHLADWLQCIRTRNRPICDVEIGARSVTVCHLVNLAYYHGQKMEWNPEKNLFIKGSGNPAWLDVPYRDSWQLPV